MDLVLEAFDNYCGDALWARLLPLKVPLDADVPSAASAAAQTIPTLLAKSSKLLSPTAIAAAARRAWPSASAAVYEAATSAPTSETVWTTVSAWPRDDLRRQVASLMAMTQIGVLILYFGIAGLSYRYIYDHRMMRHPRFLKGQVRMEIMMSLKGFPWLNIMTVPWFVGEVRGYSAMYKRMADGPFGDGAAGVAYMVFTVAAFLFFTDVAIYWVHRWLHWPSVYKHLHKPHHKWVIPTPFASHAFNPVDGYLQSLPYHIFAFIVPVHRVMYLVLFVLVNLWSIFIHDSELIVDHPLERWINGPSHHTLHHTGFNYNYGQYFTWSDKLGGSYRHPVKSDDPMLAVLALDKKQHKDKDA